ncbi:glycosyltransferase family 2 protein [Catenovulum adriaticum]|uniref:Glycosyltransferase family 2 protein n=1 Tax=Catenovulum adriaticum TaxID=2984846 RepID=A0ABY7AQU0_9ALTE|nr:glycosyltransferase family 2 protein [Catenovulum sp. TS8]WAJ70699.1 glycosyltransferase family 2 protein [Catenovulum sp. TS8]
MKLSLVIATHNGSKTLPEVLTSYTQQTIPNTLDFHIYVVDNASSDNSKEIIESFQNKLPLTYLYEEKAGKNTALNSAVRQIETDVFLFTDDDVIPNAEFIKNWYQILTEQPEYQIYGGRVNPRYPTEKPSWLTLEWVEMVCFAKSKSKLPTGPVDAGEVFGNNMLVRAELFKHGLFDEHTGPSPTSYGMGSETEFNIRMSTQFNAKAYFSSENNVEHIIHPNQMSLKWIDGRAEKFGRGQAYLEIKYQPYTGPFFKGYPRYLFSKALVSKVKSAFESNPDRKLKLNWDYHETLGRLAAYKMHKNK